MIRFIGLEHGYAPDQSIIAVDNLKIEGPGNVALVGANGAGKSTLLLLIAGLLMPRSGQITVGGVEAGSVPARELVSFIPDKPALFDDLTLTEQMTYVARLSGHDEPLPFALDLIERLGAEDLLDRFPRTLSKGQRQKASLLVATSRPFEVLLLDEPTAGLDKTSHLRLVEAVTELSEDALVLVSTHDPQLMEASTRRAEIENGQLFLNE